MISFQNFLVTFKFVSNLLIHLTPEMVLQQPKGLTEKIDSIIKKKCVETETYQSSVAIDPYASVVKAKYNHKYFDGWKTLDHVPTEILR